MLDRDLLIISCSNRKNNAHSLLPAIELYDGPGYRVLRKRLNGTNKSPEIWVLSAKHGLLWSDSHIYSYNERLTPKKVADLKENIEVFIKRWAPEGKYKNIFIWAGRDYLNILPQEFLELPNVRIATGAIGQKLHLLKQWCVVWQGSGNEYKHTNIKPKIPNIRLQRLHSSTLNYFIPDWDDYLDPEYDFANDRFSWDSGERVRLYAHELFKRRSLYDGILVSLGHIVKGKGFARNGLKPNEKMSSTRKYLHLRQNHLLMGDCGAYSYRRSQVPPFSTEDVVKLYKRLKVDIGASIDHIPFGEVEDNGTLRPLSNGEIESRIELTIKLGREFIHATQGTANFEPMGVIQARFKEEYASIAKEYIKAGYHYIALGGLVPRKDDDILQIAEATISTIKKGFPVSSSGIRVHLFGVLREGLLNSLKDLGVTSFDSGSYLRKAWLRSDKNYLSSSNNWYSAIRIPYSNDPRFQKNAIKKGITISQLQTLETECLRLIREYGEKREGLSNVLDKIVEYDSLLLRTSDTNNLRDKYETTLNDAPWEQCDCPVCRALGIEVIIFRGFNRNKRRGFHNTRVFYKQLAKTRKIT